MALDYLAYCLSQGLSCGSLSNIVPKMDTSGETKGIAIGFLHTLNEMAYETAQRNAEFVGDEENSTGGAS